MGSVYVKCPVICPICGGESFASLQVEGVMDALDDATPFRLFASCHDKTWYADSSDTQRIRDHLAKSIRFTTKSEPWLTC